MGKLKFQVVGVNPTSSNITENEEGQAVKVVTETVLLRAVGYAGNDDAVYPASGELSISLPEGRYSVGQQIESDLTVTADAPPPPPASAPTGAEPVDQRVDAVEKEVDNLEHRVDALEGSPPPAQPEGVDTPGAPPVGATNAAPEGTPPA